ncbi:MAG: indole-3-glycerol phosphate synthase TrpC [Verrucomicrobiota bacterium]
MIQQMHDKLAEIMAYKREEVKVLQPHADDLRKLALQRNEIRNFRQILMQPGKTTLIAEIKKASPSAGVIAPDFDPVNQAREYERGGAHALSVLTDEKYFKGHLNYLRDIREQVDLPLLRKDFTVSELQIYEAAVAGADAILLIVAALTNDELKKFTEVAESVQLDVLYEVHDMEEMDRALDMGADIIGINNRNLKTFEVNLETTANLASEIPADVLGISESGIKTIDDIKFCKEQGIHCFLIGESLMRSPDASKMIEELLEA